MSIDAKRIDELLATLPWDVRGVQKEEVRSVINTLLNDADWEREVWVDEAAKVIIPGLEQSLHNTLMDAVAALLSGIYQLDVSITLRKAPFGLVVSFKKRA